MDELQNFADWQKQLEASLRGPETPASPSHYQRLTPQPLEVIEAWGLDFHLANVVKYVARAGYKGDPLVDLQKAKVYLDRKLAILTAQRTPK